MQGVYGFCPPGQGGVGGGQMYVPGPWPIMAVPAMPMGAGPQAPAQWGMPPVPQPLLWSGCPVPVPLMMGAPVPMTQPPPFPTNGASGLAPGCPPPPAPPAPAANSQSASTAPGKAEAPPKAAASKSSSSMQSTNQRRPLASRTRSQYDETAKAGSKRICLRCAANLECYEEELDLFHQPNPAGDAGITVSSVSTAKLRLLQDKWEAADGDARLVRAWQIRNPSLEYRFAATQHNFALDRKPPDVIDGWHGSRDGNVLSIATHGFDPSRRFGQAYGSGEYFAKDPKVSINYTRGGHFLFLCKMLLGEQDVDHTWVDDVKYYVLKQMDDNVQVHPLYVLQFRDNHGAMPVVRELKALQPPIEETVNMGQLQEKMRGAKMPEPAREGDMIEDQTSFLWVGWLDPALRLRDDEEIASDVEDFLIGFDVLRVIPERNGARVGAFVCLATPATRQQVNESKNELWYHDQYWISIDDAQPVQADKARKPCPRLKGPGKCCRSWNLAGHFVPERACPFNHALKHWCTFRAEPAYEEVPRGSAKFDEICTDFESSAPFHNGHPRIIRIQRMRNDVLEAKYMDRVAYTKEKQFDIVEKELWHGTSPAALENLRVHGFQAPSDRKASHRCPRSGGKGLCTTLCDRSCKHCTEPHVWDKCHMYGLGVYFADLAAKSHRYTSPSYDDQGRRIHTLLRCRVNLGRPYLIEGALVQPDAMHNVVECVNPSDMLDSTVDPWNPVGHDSYYIKGLQSGMTPGRSVYNTEFVIFNGQQALPLYRVDYVLV